MNPQMLENLRQTVKEKRGKICQRVGVCHGAGCISSGAQPVLESLKKKVEEAGLGNSVEVVATGCMGPCNQGPVVRVIPEDTYYQSVQASFAGEMVERHLKQKNPVKEALLFSGQKESSENYFLKQQRIVLENCGRIDPESFEDYLVEGGYRAVVKALSFKPEDLIREVTESGLRGRGGAGYPTGLKWKMVHEAKADRRYVVCNGDEGDPGAFMDRSVLEGDPHRVIEGMMIAGRAIGADKGFLYVRAEYPLAIKRFELALKQARSQGLLGSKILETDFNFDIEIRVGAGAFVCGEETALMASIQGERGTPRPRPPYPAESGLWGKPTLINNVETFASVPHIILEGAAKFASIGTVKSKGTKVFALAGRVQNTGLIEVPMGMTLREIVFEIGGGVPGGKKFKAAQTGGPSGGCIPAEHLDTPVDYEGLTHLGSIMGSGGLIIMDETSCMVDVARFFMEFCMDESCGKCVPCRVGTKQMHDLLAKICLGRATMHDLALLEELAPMVKDTSLCGLGMTAPNPLMSTLRYFRQEYIEHIENKRCPSGVCKMEMPVAGGAHA